MYDTVANYRIDRITDIELTDTPVKPRDWEHSLENGLNLQDYVYQNLNMFSGEPIDAEFQIPERMVSVVIDLFGKHVSFHDHHDGTVSCRLKASPEAMVHWAVEHATYVKVISPESVIGKVKEELRKACSLYGMEPAETE